LPPAQLFAMIEGQGWPDVAAGAPVLSFGNAWLTVIGNGRFRMRDSRLVMEAAFVSYRGRSSAMVSLSHARETSLVNAA
jgi:hypothetical protein